MFYYHVCKSQPLVLIRNQMNVVHAGPLHLRFILMLTAHLCLSFQAHSFRSLPPKIPHAYLLLPMYATCCLIWSPQYYLEKRKIVNFLIQEFFSASISCVLQVTWETTLYTHIKQEAKFSCALDSSHNNVSPSVTCILIKKSWAWQLNSNTALWKDNDNGKTYQKSIHCLYLCSQN
jgi:hypothetical protein